MTANSTPLFYKEVVPLDQAQHREMRLDTERGYGFAKTANAVPLLAAEFQQAQRDMAVVFMLENDLVLPVAVLGLRAGENLFVAQDGAWTGNYVPAYIRRYPFILAKVSDNDTLTVCIDQSYPGLNTDQGEPLFSEQGEYGACLEQMVNLLKEYYAQYERTRVFGARLHELGLLEPLQANISLNSGEKFSLTGFLSISRERLQALAPERLAELVRNDDMALIYAHMASLANFRQLVDRVAVAA